MPNEINSDSSELDIYQSQDGNNSKAESIKSKIRFTRFLLLLVAAAFALILLFVNRDKLNLDNFRRLAAKIDIGISSTNSTDNTVINYDYNSDSVVSVYKDGIARVTSDNLVIMDNAGTQFQSIQTGFNSPALVTTDKYVMAYDIGGRHLIVTNSFTVVFDVTFDDNIISATMNDDGYFAVITESEAYKNKLVVYNSSFNEIYKLNSMSRYIISADISKDNKHVVVSSYYVKDDSAVAQLNYYSFTEEESLWDLDFDDEIAVSVICNDDDTVSALFEWGICVVDSKGNEKYRFEFENKILQDFKIPSSKYNAVALSDSHSGNSTVTVFENSGKKVSDIEINATAVSLDIIDDRIAVLTRDKIYVYSVSGNLICERENANDAYSVLFTDKNAFLVASDSDIVYNLTN